MYESSLLSAAALRLLLDRCSSVPEDSTDAGRVTGYYMLARVFYHIYGQR